MLGIGGILSKAGVPTSGVRQVETATAAGTLSGSGNISVTITAAGLAGSPLTVPVAALSGDTPTIWAAKVRTALLANAVVAAFFDVNGTPGTTIILTAKRAAANDATMNVALADGTSTGVTAAPTSADTTAGVKADWRGVDPGQYAINSSTNDIYTNTGTANSPTWTIL